MHPLRKNDMKVPVMESEGLYPQTKKADSSLRNLALGILLQAFRDIVAPKKASVKEWEAWRTDALEWFLSEEARPGSFYWVCEVLEMRPEELRDWLQRYRRSNRDRKKEMAQKLVRFQIRH